MNLLSLTGIEIKKLRRSGILLILLAATVILWLPSIFNARLSFTMDDIGVSPENNFLIQGLMGMAWFMYPASMVVCTVLINQTERSGGGILKMLALPVSTARLCLAKFFVLLGLAAAQLIITVAVYFISAAVASGTQGYDFLLPAPFVLKEAGLMYLASIPMLAVYWLLSVCIQTTVFSVGVGLASIVPSVLVINTRLWPAYPMAYPFFMVANEYGRLAESMTPEDINYTLWLGFAAGITLICLATSCLCFGRKERS